MSDEHYPDAPGAQNTDTSIEAAEAMEPHVGRLQRLTLAAITAAGASGLTAEECANKLGLERVTVQPRTTELRLKGRIRDSRVRRLNASGKRAIVWVAG